MHEVTRIEFFHPGMMPAGMLNSMNKDARGTSWAISLQATTGRIRHFAGSEKGADSRASELPSVVIPPIIQPAQGNALLLRSIHSG
jgi:hypothetical protein